MSNSFDLATNTHRLSTVLVRVADITLLESCGFGISQFKILWMLHIHEQGVLQSTIASWLNLTEAAVSRQIRLLSRDGLIVKQVDPNNRRNHIIKLSSKGEKLASNAMSIIKQEYDPYFSELTKAEQKALNQMLEKVFYKVVSCLHKEGK